MELASHGHRRMCACREWRFDEREREHSMVTVIICTNCQAMRMINYPHVNEANNHLDNFVKGSLSWWGPKAIFGAQCKAALNEMILKFVFGICIDNLLLHFLCHYFVVRLAVRTFPRRVLCLWLRKSFMPNLGTSHRLDGIYHLMPDTLMRDKWSIPGSAFSTETKIYFVLVFSFWTDSPFRFNKSILQKHRNRGKQRERERKGGKNEHTRTPHKDKFVWPTWRLLQIDFWKKRVRIDHLSVLKDEVHQDICMADI